MISIEQNRPRQLDRLAAQRQLYSTAKRILVAQLVLSGPIALATVLLARAVPAMQAWVALWGVMVLLADTLLLSPWLERLRATAARVQELFDCEVLQLPWNRIKAGNPPDPELIKAYSEKYREREAEMPPLRDWYPTVVDKLPLHIARLVCQRSNCSWDAGLRRRYALLASGALVLVCMLVLLLSYQSNLSLQQFVLTALAPLAPTLRLGYRHIRDNLEAARSLETLKDHVLSAWHAALGGEPEHVIATQSRVLQDEIYEDRRRRAPVPDSVFIWLRTSFQARMDYAAEDLVAEAQRQHKDVGSEVLSAPPPADDVL